MSALKVQFKRLHPKAQLPTRGSDGAAGYDLHAVEKVVLPPRGRAAVNVGLQIFLPPHTEAQVRPRSGLAWNHGVFCLLGTIDEDYQGAIGVLLLNTGVEKYVVLPGDRVAQLVFKPVLHLEIDESSEVPEPTERGARGFGSTGV